MESESDSRSSTTDAEYVMLDEVATKTEAGEAVLLAPVEADAEAAAETREEHQELKGDEKNYLGPEGAKAGLLAPEEDKQDSELPVEAKGGHQEPERDTGDRQEQEDKSQEVKQGDMSRETDEEFEKLSDKGACATQIKEMIVTITQLINFKYR